MANPGFQFLLFGLDTIECAYYLATDGCGIDFEALSAEREGLRFERGRGRGSKAIMLDGTEFMLRANGSSSGYPFVLDHPDYTISFGPYNNPSFYLKFISAALWAKGPLTLHRQFLEWADRMDLRVVRPETLSRVDFAFDYSLPVVDFEQDWFVTEAAKDKRFREHHQMQTFMFGVGDLASRFYDKVAEIEGKSGKKWFYELWGEDKNVWRIEVQARKAVLKRFGIRMFDDLFTQQGDLLTWWANEHTSLRIPTEDSNRSRWPLHPLWIDLQEQIAHLPRTGLVEAFGPEVVLEERLRRCLISMYGYCKQIAALESVLKGTERLAFDEMVARLGPLLRGVHDPLTWPQEIEHRMAKQRTQPW